MLPAPHLLPCHEMMRFSLTVVFFAALLAPFALGENLQGCIDPTDFDPTVDLFPDKVEATVSENWSIAYSNFYKVLTNKASNVTYLLHQCGTEVSEELSAGHAAVIPVPVQNGVAFTSTPQLPHIELLGKRTDIVGYLGSPEYLSSTCLLDLIEAGEVTNVQNASNAVEVQVMIDANDGETPGAVFVSPFDTLTLENQVIISAFTEVTNDAIYEWNKVYAAFFNLEAKGNELFTQITERYDCVEQNAAVITSDGSPKPTVLWGYYSTFLSGWSVANCPAYQCEYAQSCSANILTSTEGSVETDFGNLMNIDEFVEFGKEADVWIFPSPDWNDIFATNKEALDQMKSVKDQKVYDYQGVGEDAWFSERFVEYDVVLQDFCSVVGTSSSVPPIHQRRWFRNVFTESVGAPEPCDDPSAPLVSSATECTALPGPSPPTTSSSHKLMAFGKAVFGASTFLAFMYV